MEFEEAHHRFIQYHIERRTGERKARLIRGHKFGEKLLLQNLWWPVFGNLNDLHPEYEIYDWNRKSQFIDFAFLPPFGQFGIEGDGFQSHVKDMDREKHNYSLNRDTFLTGMGWKMLHFSIDDLQHRPENCRMLLRLVMSPYLLRTSSVKPAFLIEKEVLRLCWHLGKPVRPKDVCDQLDVDFRTARKWLQALAAKGWLTPIARGGSIRYYELKEELLQHLL
ncbi:MAG TPA: hypothetical protein VMS09_17820 [Paenibacillus sp.]|uniref:hypothetical protein n=2 Tax=Paenibacillus TaxID=44249 RepID=UPI002C6406EA|nr:hypothetical protein [Paenibacillus sp.]HUC93846.1 hypothetical protein [Paenibacillus sp.]